MNEKDDPRTGPVKVVPSARREHVHDILLSLAVGIIGGGVAGLLLFGMGVTL
jgi:hypothetical protein